MTLKVLNYLIYVPLFIFLAACGSVQTPNSELKTAEIPNYLLTLDYSNQEAIERYVKTYSAQAALFRPEEGYAVIGFDKASAELYRSHLKTNQISRQLELNQDVFWGGGQTAWMNGSVSAWAGGSVSAWAGGSVSAWAGGMVSAWAGGRYVPLPENTQKWQSLGLQEAHGLASNLGEGVTVAVIDSGIDLEHAAFKGGLVAAKDRWDFVDNDPVPQELGQLGQGAYGHGTNVASIVLQIAPRAKIMPLRVLKPNGSGDVLAVAAAIHFAVDNGADIINLSLGSEEPSEPIRRAIEAATDKGIFVVSSSGNGGTQAITFPANQAYEDTVVGEFSISVGSVNAHDEKSSFTNYGSTLEIVGPGEQVFGPVPGNRLGAWTGTSMATPMISGALALALAEDLTEDLEDLSDELVESSANIYQQGKNKAYEDLLGEGRLDIAEFLNNVMF